MQFTDLNRFRANFSHESHKLLILVLYLKHTVVSYIFPLKFKPEFGFFDPNCPVSSITMVNVGNTDHTCSFDSLRKAIDILNIYSLDTKCICNENHS